MTRQRRKYFRCGPSLSGAASQVARIFGSAAPFSLLKPVPQLHSSILEGGISDFEIFVRTGAGSTDRDTDDDLGAWSRMKTNLTRRWTSQIGAVEDISPATTTLEEGGAEGNLASEKIESAANFVQVRARTDLSGGMLEVPVPQSTFMKQDTASSRPSSAGRVSSKGSSNRNSGVMVEEEAANWLQQYGEI